MADAPKPESKGWEWGFFEILVAVVIFMAILNAYSKEDTAKQTQKDDTAAFSNTKTIGNCSITVQNPIKDQKVTLAQVSVGGTFSNCTFNTPSDVAYAQLIDSKGMSISAYTALTKTGENSFSGNVALTADPATTKGTLIVVPNVAQQDNTTRTLRIPLSFPTN